jgi:hypothetical protein
MSNPRNPRQEQASFAPEVIGRLASLAILLALSYIFVRGCLFTLSGLQEIFDAEMEILAKAAAAVAFVFVMGVFLLPMGELRLIVRRAQRYLRDMRKRVSAWMHSPSAGEKLASECVGAYEQQLQVAGEHVRWVIHELEIEVDHVTLAMVCYVLHLHAQHVQDLQRRTLGGVVQCLSRVMLSPAGDLFDRAVAEGACATQLIEDLLACGV